MHNKRFVIITLLVLILSLTSCNNGGKKKDDSLSTAGESVDYKVIGIDPGAGLMKATSAVMEEYGLEDWTLVEGSSASMTAALKKAYENKEPIIVTGWTPHWMFSTFELKYLDDPRGIYGEDEYISTIVRSGLKEEHPAAYKVLDAFYWNTEDIEKVMMMIIEGDDPKVAAEEWIRNNSEKVKEWTKNVEKVDGEEIMIAYVAWDTEIASTNVIGAILENLGYKVTLRQVEAGPMWIGVADGSVDAHVAGWLPNTHADYYDEFKGKFEDLGPNLEGTKIGLVVPEYMDINSIEDLKK